MGMTRDVDERRHAGRVACALQGHEAQLVFLAFVLPVRGSRQSFLETHDLFQNSPDLAPHAFVQRQRLFQQGALQVRAEHIGQRGVVAADTSRLIEQGDTDRCGQVAW